jgi:hypothetical protein
MFHFSTYIGNWPLAWVHVLNIFITLYPTMQIIMYKLPKNILQFSYISKTRLEFKFFWLEAYHKLNLYDIAYEFKIDMVEANHKFNLYDIANEFKIVMVVANHKFHIKFLFDQ